jgi:hypothetical protein
MGKVVYNACYGCFGLSRAAAEKLAPLGVPEAVRWMNDPEAQDDDLRLDETPRHDPRLVVVVESLGKAASGEFADLRVWSAEGPVAYDIREHDGKERVEEVSCMGIAVDLPTDNRNEGAE